MYRAFPAYAQFNVAQRGPNDVPLFFGTGAASPFAKLIPKVAEGLRANGNTHVATGLIPGSVHYLTEHQPETAADLIERYHLCIRSERRPLHLDVWSANRKRCGFHGGTSPVKSACGNDLRALYRSWTDYGLSRKQSVVTAWGSLWEGYLVHTWCTRLCNWGASAQLSSL
jgi:hypothetical protein